MGAIKDFIKRYADPQKPVVQVNIEMSRRVDDIYVRYGSRPYNPDLLSAKKGGLKIYYDMRQDDQTKACLHLKKSAIVMPGWDIESDDEELKEFVKEMLTGMEDSIEGVITSILSAFDYGFSVHEIVYAYLETGKFKGKVGLSALRQKSPTRIYFDTDDFGRLKDDGIIQRQYNGKEERLPKSKFVVYSYQKEFDNYYGESDLKAAYRPWFLKQNVQRYMGIYLERFAVPITIGQSEVGAPTPQQKSEFQEIIKNIQAGMAAFLPQGFTMELLESTRVDKGVFTSSIDVCNIAIARAILIPQLLGLVSQEGVGSYGQSQTHFDVFAYILGGVARDVEEVLNEQVIRPLVILNYGEKDKMPKFRFNPMSEGQKESLAKTWSDAVQKGAVTATTETETMVRSLLKFPEPKKGEIEKAKKEAEPLPPAPGVSPVARKFAEEMAIWEKHVQQLDDLEDDVKEKLTESFKGMVMRVLIDAKKKSYSLNG